MKISDIFTVPVLDFDNLYIISNDIEFSDALNGRSSIVIDKSTSKQKLSLIENNFPDITLLHWMDDYSTLLNAIKMEKTMYRLFAYLLIVISSLGLFSTMNYTIINKKRSILSIYNLGYNFTKIKINAFKLIFLLSILFSTCGIVLTYIFLYLHLFDPLLDILFPEEIFYNFNLSIDYFDTLRILIINTIVVLFSVYIPFNSIHSYTNRLND
jgi:ABC-type lipoprotein release transport system permease subunit